VYKKRKPGGCCILSAVHYVERHYTKAHNKYIEVHCGGVTPFKGRSLRVCCLLGCWVADGRRAAAHYANEAPRAACTYGPMVLMRVSRASLSLPSPGAPRGQRCIALRASTYTYASYSLAARCREHTSEILIPRRRAATTNVTLLPSSRAS
jgi:hypothetical protein